MSKLNFSGNLPNTIGNNILKLPVIPTGAFTIIQYGVQDGRQNVKNAISRLVINIIYDFNVYMYIYCHKDYNGTGSESLNSQAYHLFAI